MASGALFGGTAARSTSKNLVEFKAGKMTLKGKMVHPDKRKGLVYVYQSDDSLMHFCWKDRTKGTVEDDLIIFPDDIEFKHVPQCTTGRVYLLKFKSSSRKFFFWMQEPKTDKDEENRKKVNELLNNPPTPGSTSRGGSGGFSGIPPELASEGDLQSLLGNMNQQQLMQLLGGMGMSSMGGLSQLIGGRPGSAQSESNTSSRAQSSPGPRNTESASTPAATTTATSSTVPTPSLATATTTPAPATATTPSGTGSATAATAGAGAGGAGSGILLSDLQNILGSLGAPAEQKEPIDLASAITPEAMIPLLANSEVQERLMPFLPEGEVLPKTAEELRATISSPQFRQAMSSFSAALASGQLGPLMPQFGLGEDVANAAAQGDVEAFVKAMQAKKDEGKEEKKE